MTQNNEKNTAISKIAGTKLGFTLIEPLVVSAETSAIYIGLLLPAVQKVGR